MHIFFLVFYLNKLFSHRLSVLAIFLCCDFDVWVRCCVVRRLCTTLLIFRLVKVFLQFILKYYLQPIADSIMIWASTLQTRKLGHHGDFNLIILFVGILSLYSINLDAVNLFADSSLLFLAILNLYLHMMYSVNYWNEWIFFF
jgi:hypothetical protein